LKNTLKDVYILLLYIHQLQQTTLSMCVYVSTTNNVHYSPTYLQYNAIYFFKQSVFVVCMQESLSLPSFPSWRGWGDERSNTVTNRCSQHCL